MSIDSSPSLVTTPVSGRSRFFARLASVAMLVGLLVVGAVPASAAGAITAKNAGTTPLSFSVPLLCGDLVFSGTLKYDQKFTYSASGRLNFHYISQIKGEAKLNGKTWAWHNNGHEIDHIDYRGGAAGQAGYNADGTPDLAPYGGSLERWLAVPGNFQYVQEIHLLFNDRLVGKGSGKALQNQVVMGVNQSGMNTFQSRYVSSDLCA